MALIDREKILSSNPKKQLMIAFENVRSSFSHDNEQNRTLAEDYSLYYKGKPLPFLLENSRYIFSEPYVGFDFYKESVINHPQAMLFLEYEDELDKVTAYIDEFASMMPDDQKQQYEELQTLIQEKYDQNLHTNYILHHMSESGQELYKAIQNRLYPSNLFSSSFDDAGIDIVAMLESCEDADLYYALTPYLDHLFRENASDTLQVDLRYSIRENLTKFFGECHNVMYESLDEHEWKQFIESCVIMNQLVKDDVYVESVKGLTDSYVREIFTGLGKESVKDQLCELYIEHVTEKAGSNPFNTVSSSEYVYSSPERAVNRIFEDMDMYEMYKEDYQESANKRDKLYQIGYDILVEYVTNEYNQYDEKRHPSCSGYGVFDESVSVADAYEQIVIERENGFPSKAVSRIGSDYGEKPSSKYSLANKIQYKAMDAEAKQMQMKGKAVQKGQELKDAAKAVGNLPANVINDIKKKGQEFDEMDDERRKNFMTRPGYRKELFKKLKLALLYGGAATSSIALVPVVWMARHFSKSKDRRIRNELIYELEAEIKIADEKISDAQAAGDQNEKYRLMRIKSKLEQNLARVKVNSKVI